MKKEYHQSNYGDFESNRKLLEIFRKPPEDRLLYLTDLSMTQVDFDIVKFTEQRAAAESKHAETIPELTEIQVEKFDPAHDKLHINRVLANVDTIINEQFAGDRKTSRMVRAAAIVHDILTYPKNTKHYKHEATDAATFADNLLRVCEYADDEIPDILRAVNQSSYIRSKPAESPEAKLLFDADKLDQIGAVAIMRYFASGGQMGRSFFYTDDPLAETGRTLQQYHFTMDALKHRIPEVKDVMFTVAAKQVADKRYRFIEQFYRETADELNENRNSPNVGWSINTGAFAIMHAFDSAGKKGQVFYDEIDPFAKKRNLEPDKFTLDYLISLDGQSMPAGMPEDIYIRRQGFLRGFFLELEAELSGNEVRFMPAPTLTRRSNLKPPLDFVQ